MKKISIILAALFCFFALFACARGKESAPDRIPPYDDSEDGDGIGTTPAEIEFTSVSSGGGCRLGNGAVYELPLDTPVDKENYIEIDLDSQVPVSGEIEYLTSANETVSEDFFVLAGESPFRMILDFYNEHAIEKLVSLSFRSAVGGGDLLVRDVSIAEFPIDISGIKKFKGSDSSKYRVYLAGNTLKIGCSLESGGALDFLSHNGVKSCKVGNRLYVGTDGENKEDFDFEIEDTDVNLLNLYDNGRLVQQSYYGVKYDNAQGYKGETYNGNKWPYNPVQGGSVADGCSRIVDMSISENAIYVKTRPLDWAHTFSMTDSYMENRYTISESEDGTEYVSIHNRYTDFTGYTHAMSHQELPAFYGIAPLGKAVYYGGNAPYTGAALTERTNLGFWAGNPAENRLACTENWIAWVNEENFGVGLFVPDVKDVLAGRTPGFGDGYYLLGQNASSASSSVYAAPLATIELKTYSTFEYDYYITAGEVNAARKLFCDLRAGGVANSYIAAYAKPAW